MNMIKRFFSVILLVAVLIAVSISANAAAPSQNEIEPRYVGVLSVNATLSISSSGLATASGKANLASGYTADLTLALQRVSGSTVTSWNYSGSGSIAVEKNYYGNTAQYWKREKAGNNKAAPAPRLFRYVRQAT